jgi:hypothetical protein
LKVSRYTEEEDTQVEKASALSTRMERRKKVVDETSSEPQTVAQTVATESLQDQGTKQAQESTLIEQAKGVEREVGIPLDCLVKKTAVEDAQKVVEFTEAIQSTAANEVGDLLKATMQVRGNKQVQKLWRNKSRPSFSYTHLIQSR